MHIILLLLGYYESSIEILKFSSSLKSGVSFYLVAK